MDKIYETNSSYHVKYRNHKFNCGGKCLIYLFTCECCEKQYVEETTGEFRFRWNNYKSNERKYTRNEDCLQENLFRHFYSEEHTGVLENVKMTLIDEADSQNLKKKKETTGGELLILLLLSGSYRTVYEHVS